MSNKTKAGQPTARQKALLETLTDMAVKTKAFAAEDKARRKKISRELALLREAPMGIKLLALAVANPFGELGEMAESAQVVAKYFAGAVN